MTDQMTITLNGEKTLIPPRLNVRELLEHLGIVPERVAVEVNREIVRRAQWPSLEIREGDEIEIVHFVGGG